MNGTARAPRALFRALPPAIAGAILLVLEHRGAAVAAWTAAAMLLALGLLAPGRAEQFDRAVERGAHRLATGVSRGLAIVAWALAVLPVWAVSRLVRRVVDLRRRRPASAWLLHAPAAARTPDGAPLDASRASSVDLRTSAGSRVLTLVSVLALTGLLTAVLVAVGRRSGVDEALTARSGSSEPITAADRPTNALEWDGLPIDEYAHEDEPWIYQHFEELLAIPSFTDPFLGIRMGDYEGETVTISDGRRASYVPEDAEITVWFFGGSTMYGIGQRDEHTIASVVARAAEVDGIRIEPVNFAVSGFVNWQSLEQFEQALSSGADPPDLAIFYEGVNDWSLGFQRTEMGDLRRDAISRLAYSDDERDAVRSAPDNLDGVDLAADHFVVETLFSADQYRRGSQLVDALGRSYGVPVVHVWQPSPFAKLPTPADDGLWERLDYDPRWLEDSRRRYREVRERSGVDPIDLSRVLDDNDRPVYFDRSHTNELGARIIGEALYQALRPQLEALAG